MSLPVVFTKELGDYIQYIKFRNQNNDGYVEWKEYLDWIVHHLSKPSIAWDYAGDCKTDENGITFFDKFGYSLDFIVKIDEDTTQAYVSIIKMDLNLDGFGLVENRQRNGKVIISESRLRKIIAESIRKVLYN